MVQATVIFRQCDPRKLDDPSHLAQLLRHAAKTSKLHIIGERFHSFKPQGFTGILLLSESHISIHTWPENELAVLSFFSCGQEDPDETIEVIRVDLRAKDIEVHKIPILLSKP